MMRCAIYIVLVTLLAGCAGSRFHAPELTMPDAYIYGNGTGDGKIDTLWWQAFGDTTLNRLITTALADNKDIAVAVSRLEQARLSAGIARTQYLPTINLSAYGEGDYDGSSGITQEYAIKPTLSWEIGFFGKMQRSSEAAKAQYLASEYGLRAARLAVAAQVADTYFQLLQYRTNLHISSLSYALRRQSTAMIDSMFVRGLSSGVDLEQARGLTEVAAAAIPQYERATAQTSLSLDILLGRNPTPLPEDNIVEKFGMHPDSIGLYSSPQDIRNANQRLHATILNIMELDSLLSTVPAGLPSSLLERRPDVMQAYQLAAYASAQAGLAEAARYPSITLTGDGGILSASLKGLTTGNPFIWSSTLSLFQPVFGYGQLNRRAKIAQEEARQAVLEYEKTVITALSEVEGALVSISTLRDQTAHLRELLKANFSTKIMTDALYRNGMVGYLDVLDADRSLYATQTLYVATLSNQFSAYITLFKALGGGYGNN